MRSTARLLAGVMTALLVAGCSDDSGQIDRERPAAAQPLAEKDVLERARAEIPKLGVQLPDDTVMDALVGVGFEPKVTRSEGGWRVSHPLGHPWAAGWIHLEMDPHGKILHHRIEPGQ